jgi:primosomal protein N'
MYVLSVIPLSRTAPPLPLSYRSATQCVPGALVSIPLRKRMIRGLVVECIPVREAKYILKTASFTLAKSIDTKQGKLPNAFLAAAEETALYHACTAGSVLAALMVPVLPESLAEVHTESVGKKRIDAEISIERCEAPLVERRAEYEKLCREGTTVFVVPTQAEAEEWAKWFSAYKPLVLTGKLTRERREAALTRASTFEGLIITTPSFSWVPTYSLSRIIIERASAGTYSLPKRPYLDLRYALAALARSRGVPLMYGDYPLPLEYRENPESPLPPLSEGSTTIIDVRVPKKGLEKNSVSEEVVRSSWRAIPETLRKAIRDTLAAEGRVAVLAIRKGYAPSVVCGDCGTALTDAHGQALTLATQNGVRVFRSTSGGVVESVESFCKVCGSWNLKPIGIGIELVEEELRAAFPKVPLISLTEENRKNTSLKNIRAEIELPGTLILGTESMLPLISPFAPVELGIIASADSLLALPFWRSRERFVRVGRMFAERAHSLLIATRRPDDPAFTEAFWHEENQLRSLLSYPPYGTLIVFHIEGSQARISEAREALREACAPHLPYEVSERAISASTFRASVVLQLSAKDWPDAKLSARIAALSPAIRVQINAESLW